MGCRSGARIHFSPAQDIRMLLAKFSRISQFRRWWKRRQEAFEERRPIWKTAVSKEQKQKAILKNDFKQKNHFTCKNHLGNI